MPNRQQAEALLAGNEHEVVSHRVPKLVRNSNCLAYGCEFIALAACLGTKVVTMDGKVLREFSQYMDARMHECES